MKIHLLYQTTSEPWGGINSFFRSFNEYLVQNGEINIVDDPLKADIVLLAASSKGINQQLVAKEVSTLIKKRFLRNILNFKSRKKPILVHRLDGLRALYAGEFQTSDQHQIDISQLADFIIFQSEFSLENFKTFGYDKHNFEIVYNGVNTKVFSHVDSSEWDGIEKLRIVACSWSSNVRKGHEIISQFSLYPNVEVTFVGNWNDSINPQKTTIVPPLKREELVKIYQHSHVFLHAAQNDPCPNVVLEAMSCGLPVIYHPSGGTPELAKNYGISLPESQISDVHIEKIIADFKFKYSSYRKQLVEDQHKFSMNVTASKYIKIFQSLLE